MAEATAARGTLLKIGDGGSPETFVTVGRISSVGELKGTTETIDSTAHDSPGGVREFLASLSDYGTVPIRGQFVAGDVGQDALSAAFDDKALHNIQIEFPTSLNKRWAATVLVIEYGTSEATIDGLVGFVSAIKVSSKPVLEDVA